MAILESDDANVLDAEPFNWRLIVYPLLAAVILGVGGFVYYYYQQNQRDLLEAQAHDAFVKAKTPEEMVKVADQFPHTDQATMALLNAASLSFDKRDYDAASKDYQRVIDSVEANTVLRDSAQLGLASTLDANGKPQDAINAYLVVARRGKDSPYAPYAYHVTAGIYKYLGDKENERETLMQLASLGGDSSFVKDAQVKLKTLNTVTPSPTPSPAPATNTAPAVSTPPVQQK